MRRTGIIARMNRLNTEDDLVKEFACATGEQMDSEDEEIEQIVSDMLITTCSAQRLEAYEKEAGITPPSGQPENDRKAAVIARWRSAGKCDIELLRATAEPWNDGGLSVSFTWNKIEIKFTKAIPADLGGLMAAIEESKPAHIAAMYALLVASSEIIAGIKRKYAAYGVPSCGTFACGTKPRSSTAGEVITYQSEVLASSCYTLEETIASGQVASGTYPGKAAGSASFAAGTEAENTYVSATVALSHCGNKVCGQ